jgi:pimeloyl-ACP methyl ester carboxylesterase
MLLSRRGGEIEWLHREEGADSLIVLIHGAGQSSAEFSPLGLILGRHIPFVAAIELLGHGNRPRKPDLSSLDLIDDARRLVMEARRDCAAKKIILTGHSMGACIATTIAAEMLADDTPSVASAVKVVAVITMELVASQARASLARLADNPRLRPSGFASMDEACEWAIRSGMIKSPSTAVDLVLPGMLEAKSTPVTAGSAAASSAEAGAQADTPAASKLEWKVDLAATASSCWDKLLEGHTERFLSLSVPKLLLLSVTHNTDATLLTAQMQGKFAVRTIPFTSHLLHAEAPRPCCQAIVEFLARSAILDPRAARGSAFATPMPGGPDLAAADLAAADSAAADLAAADLGHVLSLASAATTAVEASGKTESDS